MKDVKILVMTRPAALEREIKQYLENGYKLLGPVTVAVKLSNDIIYVATLVEEVA